MLNKKLFFLLCIGGLHVQTSMGQHVKGDPAARPNGNVVAAPSRAIPSKAGQSLQKNVPCLIENVGQIKDQHGATRQDINFKLPGDSRFNIFIGAGSIYYQWINSDTKDNEGERQLHTYRLEMQLLGANTNATVIKKGRLDYKETHMSEGGKEAYGYEKIAYKNIYPNIDWELYLKDGKLEYDFVVHPGGKVSDIRLKYNGATKTVKRPDGSIIAYTPAGHVEANAPFSFTKAKDSHKAIAVNSSFRLKNDITTFAVGRHKGTLIIDPVLEWATYYGGAATEDGYGVTTDPSGNVYMTGYSLSPTNIATSGSYQSVFIGGILSATDVYLVKFDSTGVRQWATYYGDWGTDNSTCITSDPLGNVYIAGNTSSLNGIASPGSFQVFNGGATDAFLAKFSPSGNLVWSTFYGGTSPAGIVNSDYAYAVKCDDSGNVYMAGQTNSTDNIATAGSYQPVLSGLADAYVVKFDSTGARQWGTYLGGTGFDQARALNLDSSGNIYVAGGTQSPNGIASTGSAQTTLGGNSDGFLIKLNNEGAYQWGTYFGGTDYDGIGGVTCDEEQNIYISGNAGATSNALSTTGSHQSTAGGNGDAILAKFDPAGTKVWATYYGGSGIEQANAVAYDGFGNIYVLGSTKSIAGIATAGTFQDTISMNGSRYEAFLAKFEKDGTRIWGTYYGGKGDDYGKALAMYATTGDLYFSGQTKSPNNIVTPGCHQDTMGNINSTDAFLVKFYECPTISKVALSGISGPDSLCPGSEALYTISPIQGVTSYVWTLPNGWTGASTGTSIQVITGTSGGNITARAYNSCDSTALQTLNVHIYPFFPPMITVDSLTLGTATPYASYQWYLNGQLINGATNSTHEVTQNGNYTVAVVSVDGCTDTSAVYVVNNAGNGTGIGDPAGMRAQIRIYPNPSSDFVHITAPVKVNATITSIDGRPLGKYKDARKIPVAHLASGIYMLCITDSAGAVIKAEKFIKK
jgi:hypothetical protein